MYTKNKGVSMLFAIMILTVLMAVVLGLSGIIVTQMKTLANIGDSTIAFYAADAGAEAMIKLIISGAVPPITDHVDLEKSSYDVKNFCCNAAINPGCYCPAGDPGNSSYNGMIIDPNCLASRYCVQSVGNYPKNSPNAVKKAIQVEL